MLCKFAQIEYIPSLADIPMKPKFLMHAPERFKEWYIDRYNPYVIQETTLLDEAGYLVQLPICETDMESDTTRYDLLLHRTLEELVSERVDICTLPGQFRMGDYPLQIADGQLIFPFFLPETLNKALKLKGKDLKNSEIVILEGPKNLSEIVISCVYPEVNYLTLMSNHPDEPYYENLTGEIFADTGLNFNVSSINKRLLSDADVVINLSSLDDRYTYHFKRDAVYIDIGKNVEKRIDLIRQRQDLFIIDGLQLKHGKKLYTLPQFELGFYIKSKEYRNLHRNGYDPFYINTIQALVKELHVTLKQFITYNKSIHL